MHTPTGSMRARKGCRGKIPKRFLLLFLTVRNFFFRDFWPDQNALNVILLFEERNALRVSFFCQWLFSVYCSEYSNSGTGLKECAVTSVFRKD